MNPIFKHILVVNVLALIFSWNALAISLTFAYEDKEQPPFYMGDSSQVLESLPGVNVEILKKLESKIPDLKITFVRFPWKRCLATLQSNKVQGAFNSSYKTERLEQGWYPTVDGTHNGPVDTSKRLCTISYSLYALENEKIDWDGKKFGHFQGPVAAMLGYSIVDDLKKMGVAVQEDLNVKSNLESVLQKFVKAAALQDVTADAFIKKNQQRYSGIQKFPIPLSEKAYFLMLSKQFIESNPDLAKKIWDEIKNIREAEFASILAKYK